MLKNLKLKKKSKKTAKKAPKTPGVYIFWLDKKTPLYIGKANNLKNRVTSYFQKGLGQKTQDMVNSSKYLSFIKVGSELEALLLEAKLIRKFMPKFNIAQKDDKHPLYIRITNEKYPRVIKDRKVNVGRKDMAYFGPFPSSNKVKGILKMLRRIFPYSTHKLGKRACIYSQIGLCNPCPNKIENIKNENEKKLMQKEYKENIRLIKGILSGRITWVRKELEKKMVKLAKEEKFEEANKTKEKIETMKYITQPITPVKEFLKNPQLIQDIRNKELNELKKLLLPEININRLRRIECYDIAHIMGKHTTASMVTFIHAEKEPSEYKRFRVRQKSGADDVSSMKEIAERRVKHLADWSKPDLIIVDGGKAQVNVFNEVFEGHKVPVIGLAKRNERLVIPLMGNKKFIEKVTTRGPARNLVQRLRDEAHRFARRYHHKLLEKSLLNKG